jgi:hypothetical protein
MVLTKVPKLAADLLRNPRAQAFRHGRVKVCQDSDRQVDLIKVSPAAAADLRRPVSSLDATRRFDRSRSKLFKRTARC